MLSRLITFAVCTPLAGAALVVALHPSPLAKMMAAAGLAGLTVTVVMYLVGSVLVHGRQIVTYRRSEDSREGVTR